MSTPTRVLAYVRVSTGEQGRSGTSLDGQRDEIARYCTANAFPGPKFYVEVESAGAEKLERRTKLRSLLDSVAAGDLVVVSKQDRWSRDTLFYLQSTREIVSKGARFFSLAERFDPGTPEGQFAATIMAAVAEQERARIHARTVGRRRELRAQGCWTEGPAPFGYRNVNRRLVIEPTEAATVRELFRLCIAGSSMLDLVSWIEDRDLQRLAYKKTVHTLLRRRWYIGEIESAGVWNPSHEAIVDRATFAAAAAAMQKRRLGGAKPQADSKTQSWLGRGLLRCATCGSRMSASYGGNGYYACGSRLRSMPCETPYVRRHEVDAELERLAKHRLMQLADELAKGPPAPAATRPVKSARDKIEKLSAKRERTIDLMTDGTLSKADGQLRLAKIDADSVQLAREALEEDERSQLVTPEVRREALRDVQELMKAWRRAKVPARREILGKLADSLTVDVWGGVNARWRTAAELRR
jgi:DNA invertase Pin-like site-specific DNA recombinase